MLLKAKLKKNIWKKKKYEEFVVVFAQIAFHSPANHREDAACFVFFFDLFCLCLLYDEGSIWPMFSIEWSCLSNVRAYFYSLKVTTNKKQGKILSTGSRLIWPSS
jgi:hypothetical protein